jgi:hypothetical protein
MTGMRGVYLAAAELAKLGFVVSPTSRGAFGADLLVTDQQCQKAWSVQVKTNSKVAGFWLVSPHVAKAYSDSHVYVFVNLKGDACPEYFVVPSAHVARIHRVARQGDPAKPSVWYSVFKKDIPEYDEAWQKVFGDASTTSLAPVEWVEDEGGIGILGAGGRKPRE